MVIFFQKIRFLSLYLLVEGCKLCGIVYLCRVLMANNGHQPILRLRVGCVFKGFVLKQ